MPLPGRQKLEGRTAAVCRWAGQVHAYVAASGWGMSASFKRRRDESRKADEVDRVGQGRAQPEVRADGVGGDGRSRTCSTRRLSGAAVVERSRVEGLGVG